MAIEGAAQCSARVSSRFFCEKFWWDIVAVAVSCREGVGVGRGGGGDERSVHSDSMCILVLFLFLDGNVLRGNGQAGGACVR